MARRRAQHRAVRIAVEETDEHFGAGDRQPRRIDPSVRCGEGQGQPNAWGLIVIGLREGPQSDLYPALVIQHRRLSDRAEHPGRLKTRNRAWRESARGGTPLTTEWR